MAHKHLWEVMCVSSMHFSELVAKFKSVLPLTFLRRSSDLTRGRDETPEVKRAQLHNDWEAIQQVIDQAKYDFFGEGVREQLEWILSQTKRDFDQCLRELYHNTTLVECFEQSVKKANLLPTFRTYLVQQARKTCSAHD
nr:hypothetical protein [uncultured bacterium]